MFQQLLAHEYLFFRLNRSWTSWIKRGESSCRGRWQFPFPHDRSFSWKDQKKRSKIIGITTDLRPSIPSAPIFEPDRTCCRYVYRPKRDPRQPVGWYEV